MSTSSAGTAQSLSVTSPAAFQQPYIDQILKESKKLYEGNGPNYFNDSTVAPQSQATLQGQEYLRNSAPTFADEVRDWSQQAYAYGINQARNVESNPFLAGTINAATRPVINQFNEQVLPQIRSGAQVAGGYGDSRQGIAEGLAADRLQKNLLDTTSTIANNAYNVGQQTFSNTLSQAPMVQNLSVTPAEMLFKAGASETDYAQQVLNDKVQRWLFEQNQPYSKLIEYSNVATRPFGAQGSSISSGPSPDLTSQILGAGALVPGMIDVIRRLFQ